jgi:hypothetical protein
MERAGVVLGVLVCLSACGTEESVGLEAGVNDSASNDPDAGPQPDAEVPDFGEGFDLGIVDAGEVSCSLSIVGRLNLPMDRFESRLSGPSQNFSMTCTPDIGTGGPEQVLRLRVETPTGVFLRASSQEAQLAIAIRRSCDDPLTEVACGRADRSMSNEAVLRAALEPGDYFVLVDVLAFGVGGSYAIEIAAVELPQNSSCEAARSVADGDRLRQQDPSSAPMSNLSCGSTGPSADGGRPPPFDAGPGPGNSGQTLYYRAIVPPGHRLSASAYSSFGPPPQIFLFDGCGGASCLGFGYGAASFTNSDPMPREVVIATLSQDFGRPEALVFDLAIEINPLPQNAICSAPIALTDGAMIMGDTSLGSSDVLFCPNTPLPPIRGLLYYAATIPAGEILRLSLIADSAGFWQPAIAVIDACGGMGCQGVQIGQGPGTPTILTHANTTSAPITVLIVVGAIDNGDPNATGGPFTLSAEIAPLPANAICSGATPVADGAVVTGDTGFGASDALFCGQGPGPLTGLLYYSVRVPPGQAMRAVVRPTAPWEAAIAVVDACGSTTCLASSPFRGGGEATVAFGNTGSSDRDLILVVGAYQGRGTFTMQVELDPLPMNASCAMATPVMDGAQIAGDTSFGGMAPFCPVDPARLSGALYYSVTLPAGYILGARVQAMDPMVEPRLELFESCTGACLAGSSSSGFDPRTLVYSNTTNASRTLILVVADAVGIGGRFVLDVSIRPPPMNARCASATPVSHGTQLFLQDVRAGTDNLASACEPSAPFGVLYYRARVAPAERLVAAATPTGGSFWAPLVRILPRCGATSCLASGRTTPGAMNAALASYTNTGTSALDLIIAVGPSDQSNGFFDLTVSISRPPYVESSIPTSCTQTSTAPIVQGPQGDDTTSGLIPLPIRFSFFGSLVSQFSVSSNGVAQLYAGAGAMPSASLANAPLPSQMPPDGLIAAFWDDLLPGQVRTMLTHTPGGRVFVIDWSNFTLYGEPSVHQLSFQVKLFENTGAVEIHYCTLNPITNPRVIGASASVGMEDARGLLGVEHSFDRAALSPMNAIRFTPAP